MVRLGMFMDITHQKANGKNNLITVNRGSGLFYADNSAGAATGNTIGFSPQSNTGRIGVQVTESASPLIDGNTLTDDPLRADTAFFLNVFVSSTLSVTNNQICVTGSDAAFQLSPGFFATGNPVTVSGNTLTCEEPAAFVLGNSTFTVDSSIGVFDGGSLFRIATNDLTVVQGVTLSLGAGVNFDLRGSEGFDLFIDGTLNANGATFTNADIQFREGSSGLIENSTIEGPAPLLVTGTTIPGGATPVFRNNIITATGNSAQHGVAVTGTGAPAELSA